MENILDLLLSDFDFNITIKKNDLLDFANYLISKTKKELEDKINASKHETYLTRTETYELLKIDQSTLWRLGKRGIICPIDIGGKKIYRMSDITRLVNGG